MSGYKLVSLIINKIVRIFFKVLGFITILTTLFTPLTKSADIPPIRSELLTISAKKLAAKIRKKEIKCTDVIELYINRIKEVNPLLNSVVEDRFNEALKEGALIDRLVEEADDLESLARNKPLLGVPVTIKECIGVKGLSNNCARSRVDSHIAEEDAECVALLRQAGAIPLVVTNTPELCIYLETFNPVNGRTNNPYDTRRTVSGSSGGEAALLGAGASVIGVGSDIAGSLRFPATFCGIFSHKPTPGFVSNKGHIPTSKDPLWDHYFTIGPLARYAEDLPVMLQAMIPTRNHIERLSLNEHVDLGSIRVYYMYGEGSDSTLQYEPNFQVKKAVKMAVDILNQKYKCTATKVDLSYFKNSLALTVLILQLKGVENVYQTNDEDPDDYSTMAMLKAVVNKFTFQSNASISAVLFGPLQTVIKYAPMKMKENIQKRAEYMKQKLLELLGDDGILVYPTFPTEAPFHNRMSGHILNVSYCSIFNVLGLPVTQCPIRFTRDGLPVGVQIVAGPHMDRLCLAAARALEKVTGGWKPPDIVRTNL